MFSAFKAETGKRTMRNLIPGLLCSCLFLFACTMEQANSPSPDLIVVNADVRTVDSTMPRVEAFAVHDGKFITVGTTAEIPVMAGDATGIIDAGGVTIRVTDTIHGETRIDDVVRPWDEGNTLTFDEALYGYSQAGTNLTAWSGEIGSISVGNWADFVILDERHSEKVDRALENRQVTGMYLAGRQVYPGINND